VRGLIGFANAPVSVLWGGASTKVAGVNTTEMSDWIDVCSEVGQGICISFYFSNSAQDNLKKYTGVGLTSGYEVLYKAGDDATTLSPTGYSSLSPGNATLVLDDFEFF